MFHRLSLVLLLGGCAATLDTDGPDPDAALTDAAVAADGSRGVDADRTETDGAVVDRGVVTPDAAPADAAAPPDAAAPADMAPPPDMEAPPPPVPPLPPRDCVFAAEDGSEQGFDVGPNSPERLRFEVRALPAPALVDRAVLTFAGFDLDHPGEEGVIYVNGQMFDLPASLDGDSQPSRESVDITGATAADRNIIEFGPGPLDRSFFRISEVAIATQARVADCPDGPPPPPPPPPNAVVREILYPDAEYTNRTTWVLGCLNNAARRYAFTASGDEHVPTDCDGLYRAGGNRRGDAIFRFDNVVEASYDIVVRARHTENRSPNGALFLVNGETRRLDQRGDGFVDTVWGQRRLSGRVEVILRAEGNSDSVISVKLVPAGG